MNLKIFNSLFKKESKKTNLSLSDSILVKKLKKLCQQNNYILYENITIYHHNNTIFIPFIILDPLRGIYLFEDKDWDYHQLSSHKIQKQENAEKSKNSLSFKNTTNLIEKKLAEVIHNYSIGIFNFLLTPNLALGDYEHLDNEKKALLPNEKIIFNDTKDSEILSKLKSVKEEDPDFPKAKELIANLLTQFLILDKDKPIELATDEQQKFILNRDYDVENLEGLSLCGKTNTIILKAILLKLEDKNTGVTIIKPTVLSCDLIKISLMNLVEYSIVDVDITSIKVITPEEFEESKIITDYILCDDSNLIEEDFINYLLSFSKKSKISLVNSKQEIEISFKLTENFQKSNLEMEFIKTNPYEKSLELLQEYAKKDESIKILLISSEDSKINIFENIDDSVKDKVVILDSSKKIIDQESSYILLSDYTNINAQRADIIILLDMCELSQEQLGYAISLANEKVYLIYEIQCDNITTLKKIFKQ